jgi:hypothetical protein
MGKSKKLSILLAASIQLFTLLFFTSEYSFAENISSQPPHLDLDLSSREYKILLRNQEIKFLSNQNNNTDSGALTDNSFTTQASSVADALKVGAKLLAWIELINSTRSPENKLRLTSPQTRTSYPITSPKHYSISIIQKELDDAHQSIPHEMSDVIFSEKSLPTANPISDEDFITNARIVDKINQTASRWQMLYPYKSYYVSRQNDDIRGYYTMTTKHWDNKYLENWSSLDNNIQTAVRTALASMCINSIHNVSYCNRETSKIASASDAVRANNRFLAGAKRVYDSFFQIQNPRRDIEWNNSKAIQANLSFIDPLIEKVRNFLKLNIEDEYKWGAWNLKIDFNAQSPAPHVVFEPGTTAHVNELGGDEITMDANRSLEEYEEQWTIRHEFGHVLGFPDCYHEFFDADANEFVSYQIDITDLMCSRAGNFNERMFHQLEETYARK